MLWPGGCGGGRAQQQQQGSAAGQLQVLAPRCGPLTRTVPAWPTHPHQIEEFEAEAEAAAGTKKGKKPAPRVAHMEESIARHRQHIVRLEQILRLLDNDAMQGG